jgi:hypothetical protein
MLSIVYASRASESFNDAHLIDLLLLSRRNNKRLALSGMLLYRSGYFLQVIEGPEDVLRHRMAVIATDPRHTEVRVLLEETITERMFPAWTMGYEATNEDADDRVPGLRAVFEDLVAGRDVGGRLSTIRGMIRWFQAHAA